ncbi:PREDICTED: uncharacterized protein LOC105124144 isoform X2 [Populus euphratica]|uniref:Uncharacterized protein LOC105124144 isoform X2 n=1 Tax=Populus euphratica TaxID=75702 RepID=A0AAJ6XKW7_POPEU|nr:PREDICTED: uncharacterized protein LOC105124144 isoform X2 [Populus euphratica]
MQFHIASASAGIKPAYVPIFPLIDSMWPSELATTSTANEIGGSYEINTAPSMIQPPIEQYMSFLSGCLDSPTIPDSKLKRKAPDDVNRDQERKKAADRAYRLRCKFKKIKNEEDLCALTEENNRLDRENKHLKNEEVRLKEVVQTQNELMKQLQGNFCLLKSQLDKQNIVVEVLSKQLAMCRDIDRQLEIERLKCENDLLTKRINNRDSLNIIQLEAKNTKLEQEKRSFQLIIDALCLKINKDSNMN